MVFNPGKPFQPSPIFESMAGLSRSGLYSNGRLLTIPEKKQGVKYLQGANALAYFADSSDEKMFCNRQQSR